MAVALIPQVETAVRAVEQVEITTFLEAQALLDKAIMAAQIPISAKVEEEVELGV
jgi:hypothetical protein